LFVLLLFHGSPEKADSAVQVSSGIAGLFGQEANLSNRNKDYQHHDQDKYSLDGSVRAPRE
jgi:hypothetical protein